MIKPWSFIQNVFEIVTHNSYRLALRVSRIHFNALNAGSSDAFVLALFNTYKTFHLTYLSKYSAWKSQEALQVSLTLALQDLFAQLRNTNINAWDAAIAVVYAKGTTRYKALLPYGHSPFQSGSQEDIIDAIQTLITTIGTDADLADVKANVVAFELLITNAINAQKTAITTTKTKSNELETARINMCDAQYADLGSLMTHFASNRIVIGDYFDLLTIRNIMQMVFQGHVKKQDIHNVVERTVAATDEIMLENDGETELRFYWSNKKDGAIGTTFVTVAAGASATVPASDMGDVSTKHFLMVYNPDLVNKGAFTIEFI
jgi:hypothetical protein